VPSAASSRGNWRRLDPRISCHRSGANPSTAARTCAARAGHSAASQCSRAAPPVALKRFEDETGGKAARHPRLDHDRGVQVADQAPDGSNQLRVAIVPAEIALRPETMAHRAYPFADARPKSKLPTDDKSAFVEPPPTATSASSSGFTEPPPAAKP